MELDNKKLKVKITLVLSFKNNNFAPFEDGFYSILLDNLSIPSIIIEEPPKEGVSEVIKNLLSNYINYDTDFIKLDIQDCYFDDNCIELVFCCNLLFISGVVKNGSLMTMKDLVDRKIDIDERYRQCFERRTRFF